MANEDLSLNVVLHADTSDFIHSIHEAKEEMDDKLSTVKIKGLGEGNEATEVFLSDTKRAMAMLDPSRMTEGRVSGFDAGLDIFYRQFAANMARAANQFASSAETIHRTVGKGESVDNAQYNQMISNAAMVQNYAARLSAIEAISRSKSEKSVIQNMGGASELAIITRSIMEAIHKDSSRVFSSSDMIRAISKNESFRQIVSNAGGNAKIMPRIAEHAMALAGPQFYIKDDITSRAIANKMFRQKETSYYATDDVNQKFQDAFLSRGRASSPGLIINDTASVDSSFFKSLNKLIANGNNTALRLARETKLIETPFGEILNRNEAKMRQVNDFAGALYREMHDVKLGSPMYPKRLLESARVNKEMKELYEIQDLIDQYDKIQKVTPNLLNEGDRAKGVFASTGIHISTPGRMESFVIPRVKYNKNGKFDTVKPEEFAMPDNIRRAPWEVGADDKAMFYNYSQIAASVGIKPHGIQDTFGVVGPDGKYRDEKGNPIYGAPKVLAVSTADLFAGPDGRIPQDKTREEILNGSAAAKIRAHNIDNGARYFDEDYVIAAMGKETDYYIQKKDAEPINALRRRYGLKPVYGPEAAEYLINSESLKDTNKAISNTKRNNSEVISRAELGYDPIMNLGTISARAGLYVRALMNNSSLTEKELEDMEDGRIIDGAGIVDPSSSRDSIQIRSGFDQVKGVLARQDLAKQIIMGFGTSKDPELALKEGYSALLEKAKNGETQLITNGVRTNEYGNVQDYIDGIWVASMAFENLPLKEQLRIYQGLAQGSFETEKAEKYRQRYFTNVMATKGRHAWDIKPYEIFDENVQGYEGFLTSKMYKGNAKPTQMERGAFLDMMAATTYGLNYTPDQRLTIEKELDKSIAEDENRISKKNGFINLYSSEIEHYNQALQKSAGDAAGIWVMRTAPQFESETFRLPISVARSMKLDQSVFDESESLYAERLSQLKDPLYIMMRGLGSARLDQMLAENPGAIYSDTAQRIIQSEINGLLADKADQTLLMRRNSYTGLAVPDPLEWTNDMFALMGRTIPDTNPLSFLANEGFISSGFDGSAAILGRNPAVLGTFLPLMNLLYEFDNQGHIVKNANGEAVRNDSVASALNIMGFDKNAIGLPVRSLFAMNTGDFDGDTVTMYAELGKNFQENVFEATKIENEKIVAARQKLEQTGRALIQKYEKANKPPKAKPTGSLGQQANEQRLNDALSQGAMGTGYGAITKALEYFGDTEDVYTYLAAAADYYDLATSQMMNEGLQVDLPAFLQSVAQDRRLYSRFLSEVSTDISGGETKGTSIFKHGFRSLRSGQSLMDMLAHGTNRKLGIDSGDITRNIRSYAAREYAGSIDPIRDAARYVAEIHAGQYSGERLFDRQEVLETLKGYIEAAEGMLPEGEDSFRSREYDLTEYKNLKQLYADIEKKGNRYAFRDVMLQAMIDQGNNLISNNKFNRKQLLSKKGIETLKDYMNTGVRSAEVDTLLRQIVDADSNEYNINDTTRYLARALFYENMPNQNNLREVADNEYEAILEKKRTARLLQDKILAEQNAKGMRELLNWDKRNYSFTRAESYMGDETNNYRLPTLNGAIVTDLTTGEDITARKAGENAFWNQGRTWSTDYQTKIEMEELLGKSLIKSSAPFGTLMHEAFSRTAAKISSGTKYSDGLYKQTLGEVMEELKQDYDKDKTGAKARSAENQRLLGDFYTAYTNENLEAPESGISFGDIYDYFKNKSGRFASTQSSNEMLRKMNNLFGFNPAGTSFGDLLLKSLGFDSNKNKIIMTEEQLLNEKTGKLVDISQLNLKAAVPTIDNKSVFPRPDFVYSRLDENGNEVFDVVDFKSRYSGALQSVYQSYSYIKELEDLSRAAWEGDKGVNEIYKIFGRMDNGKFVSKFQGGKVIGADLLNQETITHGFDEQIKQAVWNQYLEAIQRKEAADETNQRGLNELFRTDTYIGKYFNQMAREKGINIEAARQEEEEKTKKAAISKTKKGSAKRAEAEEDYMQWQKEHDYLLGKFEEDRGAIKETRSDIAGEMRRYRSAGPQLYNKFAKYQDDIKSFMNSEAIAAFQNEYKDTPFARKDIQSFVEDRESAYKALNELIVTAAEEDPKKALDKLDLMKVGGKESSLFQRIGAIHGIVNNAQSAREGLKRDAVYGDLTYTSADGQTFWYDDSNLVGITKEKEFEAMKGRVDAAKTNKPIYEKYNDIIAKLDSKRSEMIQWAYETDADDFTSEIDQLINAPKTVEEKISDYYQKQRDAIKKGITEASQRIEELATKLGVERTSDGGFKKDEEGNFTYKTDQQGNIITGIQDEKERKAAEANLRKTLENEERLRGFNNSYAEIVAKDNARELYDIAHQKNYDQLMNSLDVNKMKRYGLNRTFSGRAAMSYNSKIIGAESDLYNILSAIKSTTEERNKTPVGSKDYMNLTNQLNGLDAAAVEAQKNLDSLRGPMGALDAIAEQVSGTFSRFVSMFGRRIFMKLISEIKQFVIQFDKGMTEIQMITLKSDSQMSSLGDSLIEKASALKVSIADITKSAATLYRQGLSDSEVNERLDTIAKFSKVSGANVADATKLITVAINTGLVSDARQAADIVTALGDNAATNAQQIEKGIEKAGAAAAADGTTFAQLAAMLTAITSTTQIGGNVAGRTLNTIMGRMNKIGSNELIVDENGNSISGSAVANLLKAQGVNAYDANGNKRSTFDVLYDLSKIWDSLGDAKQQQFATAIAGTRQYSNFAAIMQGMSEGKIDEYMELVGESSGITDQKYEKYTQSLEAALTNLKNTFDSLIHDLTDSRTLTSIIDGLSNIIDGVSVLADKAGGLTAVIASLTTIGLIMTGFKSGSLVGILGGLATGGIAALGFSLLGNTKTNAETTAEQYTRITGSQKEQYQDLSSRIDRAKELRELGEDRTAEETSEYKNILKELKDSLNIDLSLDDLSSELDDTSTSVEDLASSTENLGNAAKQAVGDIDEYADQIIDKSEEVQKNLKAQNLYQDLGLISRNVAESTVNGIDDIRKNGSINQVGANVGKLGIKVDMNTGAVSFLGGNNGKQYLAEQMAGAGDIFSDSAINNLTNEDRVALANTLSEALAFDDRPNTPIEQTKYFGQSSNTWLSYLQGAKGDFGNELIPTEIFDVYERYWNRRGGTSLVQSQKDLITQNLTSMLSDESVNFLPKSFIKPLSEIIYNSLPEVGTTGYKNDSSRAINKTLSEILGLEDIQSVDQINEEQVTERVKQVLKEAGYFISESEIAEGLTPVGDTGYYIDNTKQKGEKGYTLSRQEANDMQKAYNDSLVPEIIASGTEKVNQVAFYRPTKVEKEGGYVLENKEVASYDEGDEAGRLAAEAAAQAAGEEYAEQYRAAQSAVRAVTQNTNWGRMPQDEAWKLIEEALVDSDVMTVEGLKMLGENVYDAIPRFLGITPSSTLYSNTRQVDRDVYTQREREPIAAPNLTGVQGNILSGASYENWYSDQKTKLAVTADQFTRLIKNKNFQNVEDLINYVESSAGLTAEWNSLQADDEFKKIMSQVVRDNGVIQAPENIMELITQYLYSHGVDYGKQSITSQQKGEQVLAAIRGLTTTDESKRWFVSEDERKQLIDQEYNEALSLWESEYDAYFDGRKPHRRELDRYQRLHEKPTRKEFEQRYADRMSLDMFSEEYLSEILGADLASKIKSGNASPNEITLAEAIATNAMYGSSTMSMSQKLGGINRARTMFSHIGKDDGIYDETFANYFMSGWSGWDTYKALKGKSNTGEELNESDQKQLDYLEENLNEYVKNFGIDVEISHLSDLEKAGKILAGTADIVDKLNKEGKIKLDVLMSIQTQAFSSGQQEARLNNGTWSEQNTAAMAILGMSEDEFFLDREGNIERAKKYKEQTRTETANSYLEKYNKLVEQNDAEGMQSLIDSAMLEGYRYVVDDKGNRSFVFDPSLLRKQTRSKASIDEQLTEENKESLSAIYNNIRKHYADAYKYAGVSIKDFLSSTDYEKLMTQDTTFKNMMNAGVGSDELLNYVTTQAMGQTQSVYDAYGHGWQTLFGSSKTLSAEGLRSARAAWQGIDEDQRGYYEEFLNQLPKQVQEYIRATNTAGMDETKIAQNANEEYLKRNINTVQGAAAYADLQYQINNASAFAVQRAWDARDNYSTMEEFLANAESLQGWTDFVASEEGRKWYEEFVNTEEPADYTEAMNALANYSVSSKGAGYVSNKAMAERARKALMLEKGKRDSNSEAAKAIQTVLGSEALSAWLAGEDLTSEYSQAISNYGSNISGLTSRQKISTINDIAGMTSQELATYLARGGNRATANEAMSGFSHWSEYAALQEKRAAGGLTSEEYEDLKQYSKALENFQKNSQISFEVEGIQDLENAGELLEGTVANIKKLKKGGKAALEVTLDIQNKSYNAGQISAKLASGTIKEQDEAIMALTGATEEQLYESNSSRAMYLAQAEEAERLDREQAIESIWKEYQTASPERQAELRTAALNRGYVISANGYKYRGIPDVNRSLNFASQDESFTATEINKAQSMLLNGENIENVDLLNQAKSRLGVNALKYLRMRDINRQKPNTYSQDELDAQRAKAFAELQVDAESAAKEDALKAAELNATNIAGVFSYGRLKYEQSNETGIAANELFTTLSSGKIDSLDKFVNLIGNEQFDNWKKLIESAPELTKEFEDLGLVIGKDGNIDINASMQRITDAGGDIASVLSQVALIIAGKSTNFTETQTFSTTEEQRNNAELFMNRSVDVTYGPNGRTSKYVYNNIDNEQYKKDFESIIGNSSVSQYGFQQMQAGNDWLTGLNGLDTLLAQTLYNNGMNGISGLTHADQYAGLSMLMNAANSEDQNALQNLIGGSQQSFGSIGQFTGGVSNAENYFNALAKIRANGYELPQDLRTLSPNSEAAGVFTEFGMTTEDAAKVQTDLQAELDLTSQKINELGENVDAYANAFKNANGSMSEQNKLLSDFNTAATNASKANKALQNWKKGKADQEDKELIKSLGFTAKQISGAKDYKNPKTEEQKLAKQRYDAIQDRLKRNRDELTAQASASFAGALTADTGLTDALKQQAQSEMQAQLEGISGGAMEIEGPEVQITPGTVTYSGQELLEKFGETMDEQTKMLIEEALASGGTAKATVTTGEDGSVEVEYDYEPGKHGGGGGGGGGGKSAAQTTIDRQKHYQEELKHELNMLQIQEQHMESIGDESGLKKNWRRQRRQQEKLRDTYLKHAEELRTQMNSTKQGSDEWYQLRDQMNSLIEAAAQVTQALRDLKVKATELIISRKQRAEAKQTHRSSMLSKLSDKYSLQSQKGDVNGFENWVAIQKQQQDAYDKEIEAKKKSRKAYIDQMKKYGTGDDEWKKLQDLVYGLDEEIAQLENDKTRVQVETDKAIVAQIQTDFANRNATSEHKVNMQGSLASLYQNNKDYKGYKDTLGKQQSFYKDELSNYKTAMDKLKAEMSALEKDGRKYSDAWYEARNALYAYEEAALQVANSLDEIDRAMQQASIQEIVDKYNANKSDNEHISNMYSTAAEKAKLRDDDEGYVALLQKQRNNMDGNLETRQDYVKQLRALLTTTTDPQAWEELTSRIKEVESETAQFELSIEQLQQTINRAKFDNLKEQFDEVDSRAQHSIRQVQQMESFYQTKSQLTNYGSALKEEESLLKGRRIAIQRYIEGLKKQAADIKKEDPETYELITQEIMRQEEAYEQLGTQIEQVDKKIRENQEKIRQLRQAIENYIDKEIKNRLQKEKNMLNAEVNMQNQLLEVIKNRYREEWNIIKQDIDKKRQALEEEKNLINERLQARKNAQSQADKEEELAEYQRQLTVISADSTRTKDVKELQKKIEDLQKELAWDIADQQAAAAVESIEDQIKTYNDFVTEQEEDLNRRLQDNNNLINEEDFVRAFSSETSDNYIDIMKANNKNYKYATPEAQQQMINSWEETWKTMKGIVDTYWNSEEMQKAFTGRQSFLEYLMQSDEYKNASTSGRESLLAKWGEAYDNYTASLLDTYTTVADSGTHEIVTALGSLKDYTYAIGFSSEAKSDLASLFQVLSAYGISVNGSSYDSGWREGAATSEATGATSNIDSDIAEVEGAHKNWKATWATQKAENGDVVIPKGSVTSSKSKEDVQKQAFKAIEALGEAYLAKRGKKQQYKDYEKTATMNAKNKLSYAEYKKGGLVDFTGPAWVDGTKTRPEAFLNAYDTETIRAMVDALNYIRVDPGIIPNTEGYATQNNTIGDITITINEAQFKSDADFDEVARIVGQKFTKELSKQGFSITGYAF